MIKVTVAYPTEGDKNFDLDYYVETHMALVTRLLTPLGLIKVEVDKGISGTDPNSPPPYVCVGHVYFNSADEVHEALKTHGPEILGDIKNYTDIEPTFQISETVI